MNNKQTSWEIFTIGVYGKTEDEYYNALIEANIDIFIDIRKRRGMRGARYKFVNSKYLQNKLAELGIAYLHAKQYAPTKEMMDAEKLQDKERGVLKSERMVLSSEFVENYKQEILNNNPVSDLIEEIKSITDSEKPRLCLFCVEAYPRGCHRSLVAEAVRGKFGVEVFDL